MNKLLQTLLYEHKVALSAAKINNELVWVLRSTVEGEDFYCAFKVTEDYTEHDVIDFYIRPAVESLEEARAA